MKCQYVTPLFSTLELNCGLSSYKDFVGTNLNPTVVELAEDHSYLADIIGVNGILRTSDGFCVITKRAAWVGEHPGMLDTPGGHPEPAKVGHTNVSKPCKEFSCRPIST